MELEMIKSRVSFEVAVRNAEAWLVVIQLLKYVLLELLYILN